MKKSEREIIYYTPKPVIDYINKSAEIIKQDKKKDPMRPAIYFLLTIIAGLGWFALWCGFEQVIK
jgi:hypothetical protein